MKCGLKDIRGEPKVEPPVQPTRVPAPAQSVFGGACRVILQSYFAGCGDHIRRENTRASKATTVGELGPRCRSAGGKFEFID